MAYETSVPYLLMNVPAKLTLIFMHNKSNRILLNGIDSPYLNLIYRGYNKVDFDYKTLPFVLRARPAE